jgi:hypothetical protein
MLPRLAERAGHNRSKDQMANMSYCRFQNTAGDLDDCQSALEDLVNDEETKPLSREELAAAKRLLKTCIALVQLVAETADIETEELMDDERKVDEALDFLNTHPELTDDEGDAE